MQKLLVKYNQSTQQPVPEEICRVVEQDVQIFAQINHRMIFQGGETAVAKATRKRVADDCKKYVEITNEKKLSYFLEYLLCRNTRN